MKEETVGGRPYHHGDLRRGLIDAARRLLECEGPSALSLRAVAREAGVSPAAPYHHFKDKNELLEAIAEQGWDLLGDMLAKARIESGSNYGPLALVGVTYVRFAREHPALYRVMYDRSRDREALPDRQHGHNGAYDRVRTALVQAGLDPTDLVGLELAAVAAWSAAHGLAEMACFKQFQPLKDQLGGEEAFLRGVFEHMGIFAEGPKR
ncbi:TetR/AcrR family transcriptional regulator [Phenylobacterium sp.]|uniref:TetR/AcrR family transcriptional regulator n=1 Tax=Phenylobacterium sp. TaxID=1871053 RepID=UPI002732AB07|nr:TetR family transcriptional regulator [Phenylobacterium sp.]MDP3658581.1 TetR family transcriptional regulator [Phenylobacterium sp.]